MPEHLLPPLVLAELLLPTGTCDSKHVDSKAKESQSLLPGTESSREDP